MAARDTGLQIVLIGKIRVGKSASGNTILGRPAFRSALSSAPVTTECQHGTGEYEEQKLLVVDTPGLFENKRSDLSSVKMQEKVVENIKNSLSKDFKGTVVYLVVLQLGTLTEGEKKIVKIIQEVFGKDAEHFTMALFTRGDDLKTEGRSVEELIGEDPDLRDLVDECHGGYHVFDNKDDTDETQVPELLQKINAMVRINAKRNTKEEGMSVMKRNAILAAVGVGLCALGLRVLFKLK